MSRKIDYYNLIIVTNYYIIINYESTGPWTQACKRPLPSEQDTDT